jgi:hypothetical protein
MYKLYIIMNTTPLPPESKPEPPQKQYIFIRVLTKPTPMITGVGRSPNSMEDVAVRLGLDQPDEDELTLFKGKIDDAFDPNSYIQKLEKKLNEHSIAVNEAEKARIAITATSALNNSAGKMAIVQEKLKYANDDDKPELKKQLEDLNVEKARYEAKENAERIKLQNVTAELKEVRGFGKKTKRRRNKRRKTKRRKTKRSKSNK